MKGRLVILVVVLAAAFIYTSVATAHLYSPGPVKSWLCINRFEGSWTDSGDPYWGGLQMDRGFMATYGSDFIWRHQGGLANTWTPLEQMIAANRARVGLDWRGRHVRVRGFYPWPTTARYCGLI